MVESRCVENFVTTGLEIVAVQVEGDARLGSSSSDRADKSVCYIDRKALTVKVRHKR